MPRLTLWPLLVLLAVPIHMALADPLASKLPFYCHARTGAFFISATPEAQPGTKRCGPLVITFSSGVLNTNPQGKLGALDFPVAEIRQGRKAGPPLKMEHREARPMSGVFLAACPWILMEPE